MDIARLSMSMAQSETLTNVGMAVLGMQMDVQASQASSEIAALNSLPSGAMELAVNPSVGGNLDIRC